MPDPTLGGGIGASQILSALQNVATALNGATTAYLNVNGQITIEGIAAPTVLKTSAGRVASVSVTTAGTAVGHIYDAAALGATSKPLYVIPEAVANTPYVVNMPVSFGILVSPGSGQVLAVSYS